MVILVGLDGYAHSAAALALTADLAAVLGADVVTAHCRRSRHSENPRSVDELDAWASERNRVCEERGVKNRMVVMENDPGHGLVDSARSEVAEFVAIGSRGSGRFRGLKLGGTADYVLHHADCPVAIVSGPGGLETRFSLAYRPWASMAATPTGSPPIG